MASALASCRGLNIIAKAKIQTRNLSGKVRARINPPNSSEDSKVKVRRSSISIHVWATFWLPVWRQSGRQTLRQSGGKQSRRHRGRQVRGGKQNRKQVGDKVGRQSGGHSGRQSGTQGGRNKRQSVRQKGWHSGWQAGTQSGRQSGWHVGGHSGRQSGRQSGVQRGGQAGRQSGGQSDRDPLTLWQIWTTESLLFLLHDVLVKSVGSPHGYVQSPNKTFPCIQGPTILFGSQANYPISGTGWIVQDQISRNCHWFESKSFPLREEWQASQECG
jgi:hypothetical protein